MNPANEKNRNDLAGYKPKDGSVAQGGAGYKPKDGEIPVRNRA
jgi:hypothetical protein